jgi:cobalt-zinc-cadmium efflux system membrane fusion protein
MMPPPVPAAGVPAAPHDSPAPAPPAARARFATVLALVAGVVTGWVVSTSLGAPHLRLEALDTLVTKVRTAIGAPHPAETTPAVESPPPAAPRPAAPVPALEATVVTVDDAEAQRLQIAPVPLRAFHEEKTAVGRIAFNDDRTTAIFAPFQGRVQHLIAKPGDVLHPGSPLLAVDSSDLVQANADLLAADVAVQKAQNQLAQAERVATRQKALYEAGVGAYKDFEQADSDLRNAQHDRTTADTQREAARNRLRTLFGRSDAAIAKTEATQQVERVTTMLSPIAGTVTARKVGPGQFIRPDNTDPLFAVADVASMWLIANVAELDIPLIKVGQEVMVQVMAYPGEVFRARITYVGASVDPTVRRLTVRAEIDNRDGKLKPDMFATFRILTGASTPAPSVPVDALVREGDGTMMVWVTTDRTRLVKRPVTVGLQQDGFVQIREGVQPGELVATAGALFMSNIRTAASQ